jgi:recombination protein RecA
VDVATAEGILQKSGTWYSFDSERVGQGRENVRKVLQDQPELAQRIEKLIRQKHGLEDAPAANPAVREGAEPTESRAEVRESRHARLAAAKAQPAE